VHVEFQDPYAIGCYQLTTDRRYVASYWWLTVTVAILLTICEIFSSIYAYMLSHTKGHPRSRWVDQLWTDNNLPPADLWRRAVNHRHRGAMLRPLPAKR